MNAARIPLIVLLFCTAFVQFLSAETPEPELQTARVLSRINSIRSRQGLRELREDPTAFVTAQNHSDNLAAREVLSHRGSDGERVTERYRIFGGTGLKTGENLGAGDNTETIIRAWMDSPSHKANILNPDWFSAGFGVHKLTSGRLILVAVFSSSRWEFLDYSREEEWYSLRGRLLLNPGVFPQDIRLVIRGLDYPVADVRKESDSTLLVEFRLPFSTFKRPGGTIIPAELHVEEGDDQTIPDLLFLPPWQQSISP